MESYAGYLFLFDSSERSKRLIQRIVWDKEFTESVSEPDSKIGKAEICLLSTDRKTISYVCLVIRGRMSASLQCRAQFTDISKFEPVNLADLDDKAYSLQGLIDKTATGLTSRISEDAWQDLVFKLRRIRPDIALAIDGLDERRRAIDAKYGDEAFKIAAEEKDALGVAVEIFGLKKHEAIPRIFPQDKNKKPIPFLEAVAPVAVGEDLMIAHDAKFFPELEPFKHFQHGMVEFRKQNGRRLVVCNVNRQKLETTLGVDLIYYNDTYGSFVLVQYKRSLCQGGGNYCYRPDENYHKQIKRMRQLRERLSSNELAKEMDDFRMNYEMFYFKLCKEFVFTPESNDWIDGMYVPLNYWDLVEGNGKRFDSNTIGRWFSNTEFAPLVRDGWIGSCAATTKVISDIISESLENKKSVVFAKSA